MSHPTLLLFATSVAATFGLFEIDVWWELASLITIMLLGQAYSINLKFN
jgi:hypothetical protein